MTNYENELKNFVRNIPNFPIEGIQFKDITTVLKDPKGFKLAIDAMMEKLKGLEFDIIIGPESRGFIFGTPLAITMGKGFVPARKKGKLPSEVISKTYTLEYGENTIEIHKDAIKPGQKIVIADDLLATGGTCKAVCELVESVGAEVVSIVFFIELLELAGREALKDYNVQSIIRY
ncbi:MAG: adenine phosphoribosyltransferase [Defluviitaleaceae bacterium]|nr:adenine phosphoribosyltransferase [Defluviitaleaceae bacterium]